MRKVFFINVKIAAASCGLFYYDKYLLVFFLLPQFEMRETLTFCLMPYIIFALKTSLALFVLINFNDDGCYANHV
jgi:hypothetical protein